MITWHVRSTVVLIIIAPKIFRTAVGVYIIKQTVVLSNYDIYSHTSSEYHFCLTGAIFRDKKLLHNHCNAKNFNGT